MTKMGEIAQVANSQDLIKNNLVKKRKKYYQIGLEISIYLIIKSVDKYERAFSV